MSKRFGKRVGRVEIVWEDSSLSLEGWTPIRECVARRKRVRCHSFGYMLAHDERGVVLAGSVSGHNAAQVAHIPASQIIRLRRLK